MSVAFIFWAQKMLAQKYNAVQTGVTNAVLLATGWSH